MGSKIQYIAIFIFILISQTLFAQLDSNTYSFQTPEIKLRYYSPAVKDTLEIDNVYRIVMQGDEVLTQSGKFNVGQLSSIKVKTGKGKFWDGVLPGMVGGAVVGLIVGSMLDVDDEFNHGGYFFNIKYALVTIPVGVVLGAITGGLISSQLYTHEDFDFPGSNANFKRIELKELMEKYGRKR